MMRTNGQPNSGRLKDALKDDKTVILDRRLLLPRIKLPNRILSTRARFPFFLCLSAFFLAVCICKTDVVSCIFVYKRPSDVSLRNSRKREPKTNEAGRKYRAGIPKNDERAQKHVLWS